MRALVTGAAGFIGSHVVDRCIQLGMEVVATDLLNGPLIIQGDLRNKQFVDSLWDQGPFDFVYHLAAYAAENLSHFIRAYNYETNLMASVHLINQSINHECKCFVFTSSIAAFLPHDPYGISKLAVELDLKAAHEMFGLNYIIFRPHNVYGERQNIFDKYRNVIGIFMNQLMRGKPMTIFGDGLQTRAFTYIDDVAPIIARSPLVPEAMNDMFNIGADATYTLLDLAYAVAMAMETESVVVHLPPRKESVTASANHAKTHLVFKPPPPVSLEDGLRRMAKWVKSRGPSIPSSFGEIEITKNLPPSWICE